MASRASSINSDRLRSQHLESPERSEDYILEEIAPLDRVDTASERDVESQVRKATQCGMSIRPFTIVATILAPINIVAGMTATNGDIWKLVFLGYVSLGT